MKKLYIRHAYSNTKGSHVKREQAGWNLGFESIFDCSKNDSLPRMTIKRIIYCLINMQWIKLLIKSKILLFGYFLITLIWIFHTYGIFLRHWFLYPPRHPHAIFRHWKILKSCIMCVTKTLPFWTSCNQQTQSCSR